MKYYFAQFLLILVLSYSISVLGSENPTVIENKIKIKELRFIENKSQWDKHVLYKVDIPMGNMFLEKAAFSYVIFNKAVLNCCHKPDSNATEEMDHMVQCHAFRVHFLGSNDAVKPVGGKKFPEYYNYFLGNDQSRWSSKVGLFHAVTYPLLYPGIDLFVGNAGLNLKYEFRVKAGSDPSLIKLQYEGAEGLALTEGKLVIKTSVDDILEQRPFAYQIYNRDTLFVRCDYVIDGTQVFFSFPEGYRHDLPLIIDPVVVGATYAGSVGPSTFGHSATYDALGNIYGAGNSFGVGWPVSTGSFQTSYHGNNDVGLIKLNPSATTEIWATYLGGNNADYAHSLIVNKNNELFVYGSTSSTDFPHTTGCFQPSFGGGGADIFVAHFNVDATALLGSTYIGGSLSDGRNTMAVNYGDSYRGEIILDTAGNPCVASFTSSLNFPVSPGVYDNSYNGGPQDGVVFKLNRTLTSLVWSSYIGGSGSDAAYGLKLNSINQVYVTGGTTSPNFPTMPWSYKTVYQGGTYDGWICIFGEDLTFLFASTFFGTSVFDECFFIQMNAQNEVFVYGQSDGVIPITSGCYGVANSPQFIAKLDYSLSEVIFTTTFGSGILTSKLTPTAFLVDVCDHIYAAGWGNTATCPVSPNAVQPTTDGSDFYIIALEPGAAALTYATYFGSPSTWEHVDGGTSRFDKNGKIYEAVCEGGGSAFPTTPNAWRDFNATSWDLAIFVIDFQLSGPTALASANGNSSGCAPFLAHFNNNSTNALQYIWDFGDGTPTSAAITPSHTYQTSGTYQAFCIAIDSTSCFISDTSFVNITVLAPPVINLGPDTLLCGIDSLVLDAGNPGTLIQWSTLANTPQITVHTPGTYWVTVNNGLCSAKDTIVVTIMPHPDLGNDTSLCTGLSVTLNSGQPAFQHAWSTGATNSSINVTTSGIYWVGISKGSCTLYDSIDVNFIPLPLVELGPSHDICEGSFTTLDAGNPGAQYHWSTGVNTQQIQVGQSGMFHVTVTKQGCSSKDSVQVNTMAIPVVNLLGDRHLCTNDTLYLDAGNPGNYYLWSNGDTTQSITVSQPGEVWVRVGISPCYNYDTISIDMTNLSVYLGPDTLLCPGGSIVLNAGNPGMSYLWNTGDLTQAINVARNGIFWVEVSKYQCKASDTVHVDQMQQLVLPELMNLCGNEFLSIDAGIEADSYTWSNGENTKVITITEPAVYYLDAAKGHCTLTDSTVVIGKAGISTFYIPNCFSPNNDGENDFFIAKGVDVTYFKMQIFNRWGAMLFETMNLAAGWDGKYQGNYVAGGEYVYIIQYSNTCAFEQIFQKVGTFTVLR